MSTFQSYLIIGNEVKKREETAKIAKSFNINLSKISPDIFIISPLKNLPRRRAGSISINEIRELKKHIFQKPVKDKFKFVIIEQAEKLTTEAQNALLKIFEEPPSHAVIVLEAKNKSQILETIQSRAIIKRVYDDKFQHDDINLLEENDISSLLEKIAKVENPSDWLDNQMILLYQQLKTNLRANLPAGRQGPHHSSALISAIIERCAETKSMIESNINPKFALANLIFSLKLP